MHGEEGDHPPELQGRSLQEEIVQARDAGVRNREPRDLHEAFQQDLAFAIRFQALDRARRRGHEGLREQEHTKNRVKLPVEPSSADAPRRDAHVRAATTSTKGIS